MNRRNFLRSLIAAAVPPLLPCLQPSVTAHYNVPTNGEPVTGIVAHYERSNTWHAVDNGLPIDSIVVSPERPKAFTIITASAWYTTEDGGRTWHAEERRQ